MTFPCVENGLIAKQTNLAEIGLQKKRELVICLVTCEAGVTSSSHPFLFRASGSSHTVMSWLSLNILNGFSLAATLVPVNRSISMRSTRCIEF